MKEDVQIDIPDSSRVIVYESNNWCLGTKKTKKEGKKIGEVYTQIDSYFGKELTWMGHALMNELPEVEGDNLKEQIEHLIKSVDSYGKQITELLEKIYNSEKD